MPIHLIGIGEISQGVKISFMAVFTAREQGIMCHTEWYANQQQLNDGNEIIASIFEMPKKDNIPLNYSEFDKIELIKIQEATLIIQNKVKDKIKESVINTVTNQRLVGVTDEDTILKITQNTKLEYSNFTIVI